MITSLIGEFAALLEDGTVVTVHLKQMDSRKLSPVLVCVDMIYSTRGAFAATTRNPTTTPTSGPANYPTKQPTHMPTLSPSAFLTNNPSIDPTNSPTL